MTPTDLEKFASLLNSYSQTIHAQNAEKGFWEKRLAVHKAVSLMYGIEYANYLLAADCMVLGHGEISEGIDELRKPKFPITSTEKDSYGGEMADTILRILDNCAFFGIPIGDAIMARAQHNTTRERMHGGKIA